MILINLIIDQNTDGFNIHVGKTNCGTVKPIENTIYEICNSAIKKAVEEFLKDTDFKIKS